MQDKRLSQDEWWCAWINNKNSHNQSKYSKLQCWSQSCMTIVMGTYLQRKLQRCRCRYSCKISRQEKQGSNSKKLWLDCISEIKNTQVDNSKVLDVVMPMIYLTDYSNNYARTSETLWQYYNFDANDNITDSESFKFQVSITRRTHSAGNTKDLKIAIRL